MIQSKLRIYLCDLIHTTISIGNATYPFGAAWLASHVTNVFGSDVEVKIFKFPEKLLETLKSVPPHVIGFSHYSWNAYLNEAFLKKIKTEHPETITVLGGPNMFYDPPFLEKYFRTHDYVDFIGMNQSQGEVGIENLVKQILDNFNKEKSLEAIDMIAYFNSKEKTLIKGNENVTFNVNKVPSPYLNGWMEEYFDTPIHPVMKTTDGCPFLCSFCVDGGKERREVRKLDVDRILNELQYIASHKNIRSNTLMITDDNFGLLNRDVLIAEKIRELSIKKGFPNRVYVNFAKNSMGKVKEIAQILKDLAKITVSFQSFNENALTNTKRDNLKLYQFQELQNFYNEQNIPSYSEMILGLPGETKQSHFEGLKKLFELQVPNLENYNLQVFNGAVLGRLEIQDKFKMKTKFRLSDQQFGIYDGMLAIEADEHVLSTETMTQDEILFFRPVHWLIQFCWSYEYHKPLLQYLLSEGINPAEFIVCLIKRGKQDNVPEKIRKLFKDFYHETYSEWFDSYEGLYNFYSQNEEFEKICKGSFGKLNFKYIVKVLLKCKKEFDEFIVNVARDMLNNVNNEKEVILDEIHRYITCSSFNPAKIPELNDGNSSFFNFDFVGWISSGYTKPLSYFRMDEKVEIAFILSKKQKEALQVLVNQFNGAKDNKTIRKMFEHIKISDLFYRPVVMNAKNVKIVPDSLM